MVAEISFQAHRPKAPSRPKVWGLNNSEFWPVQSKSLAPPEFDQSHQPKYFLGLLGTVDSGGKGVPLRKDFSNQYCLKQRPMLLRSNEGPIGRPHPLVELKTNRLLLRQHSLPLFFWGAEGWPD